MNYKSAFPAALVFLTLLSVNSFAQDHTGPLDQHAQPAPSGGQTTPVATHSSDSAPELLLADGDLLTVSLYGTPDFSTDVRVDADGEITLPMLGTVTVGGLTVSRAQKLIEQELIQKRLFNDPHITIFVKDYATEGISVLGEVQKPGIYPLLGSRRLYDAISAAGGTTPKAGTYALITHRNDPEHPTRVPIANTRTDSMENNVPVRPGDTILVSKAGIVYVVGDVHMPGGFVMENDKNITVLQALALAQGANPNAKLDSAKLIRTTPQGRQDIPLPLKKILASKSADIQLKSEDIVFVPNSAGKSAAKHGAESILQMATGIAIWRIP